MEPSRTLRTAGELAPAARVSDVSQRAPAPCRLAAA